jgi:hypothetical protein
LPGWKVFYSNLDASSRFLAGASNAAFNIRNVLE